MIKAIIFDCFGVLASSPWGEFLHSLPREQVEPARALNYQVDAGQLTQDEYRQALTDLTGKEPPSIEKLFGHDRQKNEPLLAYISTLKGKYFIGLLSNISSHWITEELLNPDEVALFDDIVLSIDVGLVKPSAEIFQLAAERLGVAPTECVLIDDGPINCDGAVAAGMKAVHYRGLVDCKKELERLLSQA
jgi:putative hydrolase of the HAD superfamily